ncbi:MAG TPA: anthranilate synthase component I family protein [Chitinophagaceae bacterium]|nr:anthranilate synthase component I family protein [Chitinophagaceae bacterium]
MLNPDTKTDCFELPDHIDTVRQRMLNWVKPFSMFCFLDNQGYAHGPRSQEWLLAAGCRRRLTLQAGGALDQLEAFWRQQSTWLFGHLAYDLKNELEPLSSDHPDGIGFPDLSFFEPEILIRLDGARLEITAPDPAAVFQDLCGTAAGLPGPPVRHPLAIRSRFSRPGYLARIEALQRHIRRGDCYEINFCQEFFAENARVDPVSLYHQLSRLSPNPFSAFYRCQDCYLACASPERFLRRAGSTLVSQPIKGTAPRHTGQPDLDRRSREALLASAKERAENVMVVDLVRNDLSRVCLPGSVRVEELCGLYAFPQVYQLISTVSGRLPAETGLASILRACFPMGSMTGAPKRRVMELIEQYEVTRRGIFSGALGYIDPQGNFDFNVVIRSVMYQAQRQYLSFQAGSGITSYSDPAREWEECLLKAAAIQAVLQAG